jgi:hypothetical protein
MNRWPDDGVSTRLQPVGAFLLFAALWITACATPSRQHGASAPPRVAPIASASAAAQTAPPCPAPLAAVTSDTNPPSPAFTPAVVRRLQTGLPTHLVLDLGGTQVGSCLAHYDLWDQVYVVEADRNDGGPGHPPRPPNPRQTCTSLDDLLLACVNRAALGAAEAARGGCDASRAVKVREPKAELPQSTGGEPVF